MDKIRVLLGASLWLFLAAVSHYWQGLPRYHAQAFAVNAKTQDGTFLAKIKPKTAEKPKVSLAVAHGVMQPQQVKNNQIEQGLYGLVGERPIKAMVPFIAEKDQKVAAFLVGIAKKESDWGKHVPTLDGQDCFNYWGYKGAGSRGMAMGYGCFATPKEGVEVVGGRIGELVKKNLQTPNQFVVWKCGSSCAAHDPTAVAKWISDVGQYYHKVLAI